MLAIIVAMDYYSVDGFGQKLRKLRLHRGFQSQARVCSKFAISRQTWNLWEKGTRIPSIDQLAEISNILNINPLFFFLADQEIAPFDETGETPPAGRVEVIIPFVETRLTRKVFRFLENVMNDPGVHLLHSPGKAGVTRALHEFCRLYNLDPSTTFFPGRSGGSSLLIVDDADDLLKAQGPEAFFTNLEKSVILVGKDIKDFLKETKLLDKIKKNCYLDALNYEDFDRIVNAALPAASLETLTLVKAEACLNLVKLKDTLREIRRKQQDPGWELSFESVFELFEKNKEP